MALNNSFLRSQHGCALCDASTQCCAEARRSPITVEPLWLFCTEKRLADGEVAIRAVRKLALVCFLVQTTAKRGWDTLENGELLKAAEAEGFDVLVTPDKNIR